MLECADHGAHPVARNPMTARTTNLEKTRDFKLKFLTIGASQRNLTEGQKDAYNIEEENIFVYSDSQ